MKKQKLIQRFNRQLVIENYSNQTIKSYSSALKLFLEFVEKLRMKLGDIDSKSMKSHIYLTRLKVRQINLISNNE